MKLNIMLTNGVQLRYEAEHVNEEKSTDNRIVITEASIYKDINSQSSDRAINLIVISDSIAMIWSYTV